MTSERPEFSCGHCLGMLMKIGDLGTAAADLAIKNNWPPITRRKNVFALSLAGKCELFSCCHGNQDELGPSLSYLNPRVR